MTKLTHLDDKGRAQMVDVAGKESTQRTAVASAFVSMTKETLALVIDGGAKKGDVLAVARIAGIMAAKKTSDLIPLCHPLAHQQGVHRVLRRRTSRSASMSAPK